MSADDSSTQLQPLLDDFLELENSGIVVDRYELLAAHPEHAKDLLAFFARYDQIEPRGQSNAIVSEASGSPADQTHLGARTPQTPPNNENVTAVTGGSYSTVHRGRSSASNGIGGGIAIAFMAAWIGAWLGFSIADVDNHKMSEYFLNIPLLVSKVIGGLLGAVLGAVGGFPLGVLVNKWLDSR